MSVRAALARKQESDTWSQVPNSITVGKDILELLSSSMYLDPMTIFREYVQNAADSIDAAYADGSLAADTGHVAIEIDTQFRNVRIRDNGVGVPTKDFVRRLTAFGASGKRGMKARGFRGVGRLSGLGYCRELVFRSRQSQREPVSELIWDGRKLKALLGNQEFTGQLGELVEQIASARKVSNADAPARFFEVELRGVVRHRNDLLLNPVSIRDYLGQVAPVPFHPDFRLGGQIREELADYIDLSGLRISISGEPEPVYRPHRDAFPAADGLTETFRDLEVVTVPSVDGGVAAFGWVLHHGYPGAVPDTRVKGLRLRSGNVQVGEHNLLEELFAEPRFNSWSVGEFHVLDRRISPNGRRDHYEQNVHFTNLTQHIAPLAREISQRCRVSSIERKALRDFGAHEQVAREKLAILAQGSVGAQIRGKLTGEVRTATTAMRRISGGDALRFLSRPELVVRVEAIVEALDKLGAAPPDAEPFSFVDDPARRAVLRDVVDLIYEVSQNRVAAKSLVDRMIERMRDRTDGE